MRLFTFGCSLTYYLWPTWADLIGNDYDEYYNMAWYGRGNQYILHTVYEADSLKQFTPDDTVMVMLTSFTRNDCYINGAWTHRGSIFNPENANIYTDEWVKNFWSPEQGLMNTWLVAKSIKALLDQRGCKYEIMLGLPSTIQGLEFFNKAITAADSTFVAGLESTLTIKTSLREYCEHKYNQTEYYYFQKEKFWDVHPTVKMHADFIAKYLPEYNNGPLQGLALRMHKQIDLSGHQPNWYNEDYKKLRGIKLGTADGAGNF